MKSAPSRGNIEPPLPRALTVAGAATALLVIAGCGARPSATSPAQALPTPVTGPAAPLGATVEVAGSVDVVAARIPAPPAGSATALVEMTLASISPADPDALRAATSPAARAVVFTSRGRVIPQIAIPVAGTAILSTGPPYPDRILLTGLRLPLRTGQTVTISLTFAHAGRARLRVPVVPPVP